MAPQDRGIQAACDRRLSATRWGAVCAIVAAGTLAGAHIGKVPPALPALRADLGLTLVETGYIATMVNLLGALAGIFAGALSDRFGHRRMAIAGLACMGTGGALGAIAGSYALLLASRFLEGAGFIMTTVAGVSLVAQASAPGSDRAKAMAFWSSYLPAGASLAMLAAALVLASFGWRSLWVAIAVLTIACIGIVLATVPASASRASVGVLRLAFESLAHPATLLLSLVFAGYVAQWAAFMTWLPTFVVEERGGSRALAALLTALWVGVNVPGVLAGGWLMGHGARRSNLILAASGLQALAATGAFLDLLPDAGRYASCLAFAFCGGLIPAAVFSGVAALARSPQHVATTNGIVMQTSQLAQFGSPIAVAWLAGRLGWSASLPLMLAFAACAAAGAIAIARGERSRIAA
jgi:DHA1 family inner membrane transport protein